MKTIKHAAHLALFVLLFVLLLALASLVFRPKGNTAEDGMYDTNPNGILAEAANTVDAIFIGDSEADCAFIPHKIWNDYGISTYVCGVGGQIPYQSAGFLRQAFQNQSPKIVVVEANHLFGTFTIFEDAMYRLEEKLPVLRYHNRWKNLRWADLTEPVCYDSPEYQKGYHYDARINPADTSSYMAYTEDAKWLSSRNVDMVRYMRDYCRERGAEMILVSVPSVWNWDFRHHNGIAAMAEQLELTYIDMNLMTDEIPIDWDTETQDFGDHVNFTGALKVSAWIGQYLWDTGLFTDHRQDPGYKTWDWTIQTFLSVNGLPADALNPS